MYKFTIIFIALQFGNLCLAQNRVGNGGDGILCAKDNLIVKAEILDFYEASQKQIESTKDYKEIVDNRLQLLKKVELSLGDLFEKRWKTMQAEIEWKPDIELVDVQDSMHLYVPADKSCHLKQVALRRSEVAASQPRFLIDESFWQKLSPVSQAGLMTHELIYEHFFKLGEEDSVKARSFNAFLFSPDFEKTSSKDFWKMLDSLKVPIYKK